MDLRFVSVAEIDLDDDGFEIRKFTESARLRESLARFGILDPPWLLEKGRPTSSWLTASKGFAGLKKMACREQFAAFSPKISMPCELWT